MLLIRKNEMLGFGMGWEKTFDSFYFGSGRALRRWPGKAAPFAGVLTQHVGDVKGVRGKSN